MKTSVRYVPKDRLLTVRYGKRSIPARPQWKLMLWGLKDNTVLEDGRTVHVSKDQYLRIQYATR